MKRSDKKIYFKDEEALKQIGEKIRKFRMLKQISQEELANICEIDHSQINRMELGKVNFGISYLFKIAHALEVDPKVLL